MNAIRTTELVKDDPAHHVQPLVLWQCACGARDLPKRDYQHIIDCAGCETLATEIGEALDDLEKGLVRGRRSSSTASCTS